MAWELGVLVFVLGYTRGLNTVASNGWRMGNQDGSAIAGPGNKK